MRDKVTIACVECNARNYVVKKNKQLQPERLQYKKFCPRCNRHTMHKETR